VVVSAAGLGVGLTTWRPAAHTETTRALSAAEARRLAAMRVTNYRDGRAGVHATVGSHGRQLQLAGWVDWTRALLYLTVDGPGDRQRALLQAVPGVIATRPVSAAANVDLPPAVPPADDWRVRRLVAGPQSPPLDSFVSLLFAIAADRPDAAELLERGEARWLGHENTGGTTVDVLLGPAVPILPSASVGPGVPPSAVATDKPMGYWLDGDARLRRLAAVLTGDVTVQVDFDRAARPELAAIDALGGRPVRPRIVTESEANLLATMRGGNRARGGAKVALAVPTAPGVNLPATNLRGAGWVDWDNSLAYLAVRNLDKPAGVVLLRADGNGIAVRDAPPEQARSRAGGLPPLPPPTERGWTYHDWARRADAMGGLDLDLLLNEALSVGTTSREDSARLRTSAAWLRGDSVGGHTVAVFEIPKVAEAGAARGQARLRYWVDGAGILRRLELRTRTGAFAQLDLDPGPVPYVPAVPIA
jgi:hypothetical protein